MVPDDKNEHTWRENLFDFLHHFETLRLQQQHLPILFYLLNAAIHLFVFFSLPPVSALDLRILLDSYPALVLIGLPYLLIVLQMGIYLAQKVELYLVVQMEALCFVLAPLLFLILLTLGASSQIQPSLANILAFCSMLFSRLLIGTLFFQRYRIYSLKCSGAYIVSQHLLYQTMLKALLFTSNPSFRMIGAFMLLLLSLHTYLTHFRRVEMDDTEFRVLSAINILYTGMAATLVVIELFGSSTNRNLYLTAAALAFLYYLISVFSMKKIEENKLSQFFQYEAGYAELLTVVDHLVGLLRKKGNSQQIELLNFLFAAISEHNKDCSLPNCELASRSTLDELTSRSEKSSGQLTQRVLKKVEELLELYHRENPDDLVLTFNYLKFHAYTLRHRVKLQQLLLETKKYPLSFFESAQFYKYQRVCSSLDVSEAIGCEMVDEEVVEFEKTMVSVLTFMQQLWVEFYEEKIDLKKVMKIADRMAPHKAQLDRTLQEKVGVLKYSNFKVLSLYSVYLRAIVNEEEEALKVQDYLRVLLQRLKDSQEVQNLSTETEEGYVVISLSDHKLGSIFLINEVACNIFKYRRSEVLGRNVSSIMPQVIAEKHDAILTDFLRNKRKQVNTDQRLLFGMDANGYLFPLQLQLQRVSLSTNDEFIFIAMVKLEKVKASPIFCMVNLEEEITDHSAAFRNLFYKKFNKYHRKTVHEIIPNFFRDLEEIKEVEEFVRKMKHPKLGDVEGTFTLTPLIVKGQRLGYILTMTHKPLEVSQPHLPLTKQMEQMQKDQQLYCHENNYDPSRNLFSISKGRMDPLNPMKVSNFTLPFLNYNDMSALAEHSEKKEFGVGIKTIRYMKDHFERLEDSESFQSEVYSDTEKIDIQAKIADMQQKSGKGQVSMTSNPYFLAINLFFLLILTFLLLLAQTYRNQPPEQVRVLSMYNYEKQVRFYLPEFIIYASLYNANLNQTLFQAKIRAIQPQFVFSLSQAPFTQQQKEEILRLIAIRTQAHILANAASNPTVVISEKDEQVFTLVLVDWGLVLFFCLLVIVLMHCILANFRATLFNVYTVFLSLKEPTIRRLHDACHRLLIRINTEQSRSLEEEEVIGGRQRYDDDNEIQKIKSFKVSSGLQDKAEFLKIASPLMVVLIYCLVVLLMSMGQMQEYMHLKEQHKNYFEAIPSTSIEFMKAVFRSVYNQTLTVSNNFPQHSQEIEGNLMHFQIDSREYDFMHVLYGDVCTNLQVMPASQQLSCQLAENGILTNGIAPALNYLSEQFPHTSITTPQQTAHLLSLLELQYTFIQPVMLQLVTAMEAILLRKARINSELSAQLVVVAIVMIILVDLYLLVHSLKTMEEKISRTNGMMALIPHQTDWDIPPAP